MPISRFWSHALQPSDLEPELGREAVLVDVVHRVVAVPASDDKHGVLADHSRVAEPIERLCALGMDLLPLILLPFESAFPEVVVPDAPVIPCEHIDRPVVEHDRVVGPLGWTLPDALHSRPALAVQVEVEEVIEVEPSLALVPTEEVQTVHVCNAPCTRPLLRHFPIRLNLLPLVLADAVLI